MRVLVTGATGFIGREVVTSLIGRPGIQVIAAARSPVEVDDQKIEHIAVDLLQPGAAGTLIERARPTHLVHLAWDVTPGQFWSSAANLDWAAASQQLMARFLEAGGKGAVFAGTCAEYDWHGPGRLCEDSPIAPETFYGICKDAVRRSVCAAGRQHDVPVGWGRIFWLYGPGEAGGRLVSDVTIALLEGRPVDTSEGFQRRDFLHVRDVAGAFVAALLSGWSGPFNIGSGHAVPVRELIGQIADATGRAALVRFGTRPTQPGEPPVIEADTEVLGTKIGFTPIFSLEEGVRATVESWQGYLLSAQQHVSRCAQLPSFLPDE